ncbi:MAG: hypothetical protein GKR89_12035 [Candidatus Latescibacteria bacterium]|nr:hypothetical protein [Candidatus Latescibacterota bacterium]
MDSNTFQFTITALAALAAVASAIASGLATWLAWQTTKPHLSISWVQTRLVSHVGTATNPAEAPCADISLLLACKGPQPAHITGIEVLAHGKPLDGLFIDQLESAIDADAKDYPPPSPWPGAKHRPKS